MNSCVTLVDPAIGILNTEEIPIIFSMDKKDTTNEVFNKMSAQTSRLNYKAWLSHYPQPLYVINDNVIDGNVI